MIWIPLMLMTLLVVLAGATLVVATKMRSWIRVIVVIPLILIAFWCGTEVAKKEDDGFFNYAIGWPFVRLTERLDALAQQSDTQALTNQLHVLNNHSFSIFPNSVRGDREFEKRVDQILRDTEHLIKKDTEQPASPYSEPAARPPQG